MKHISRLLFASIFLGCTLVMGLQVNAAEIATTANGNWFFTQGSGVLETSNRANPVIGDGKPNGASDKAIAAAFTGATLRKVGDSITLSGTVSFTGAVPSDNEFRFGLFDVNAQQGNEGWLGYYVGNSTGEQKGQLSKRNNRNTKAAVKLDGSSVLSTPLASNNAVFNTTGSYKFSLTYTRQADHSLQITFSLTSGENYNMSGVFIDATPLTYTFNRVSFLSGAALSADQVSFSGVEVTYKRSR